MHIPLMSWSFADLTTIRSSVVMIELDSGQSASCSGEVHIL